MRDGETGVLVPDAGVEPLAEAMRDVDFDAFSPQAAVASARRFTPERFRAALREAVEAAVRTAPKTTPARGLISPVTIGRLLVRCMTASMSRS